MKAIVDERDMLRTEITTLRRVNEEITSQLSGYREIIRKIKARLQVQAETAQKRTSAGLVNNTRTAGMVFPPTTTTTTTIMASAGLGNNSSTASRAFPKTTTTITSAGLGHNSTTRSMVFPTSGNFRSTNKLERANDVEWMRGNWLSDSANKHYLGEAEELFEHSKDDLALTALRRVLARQAIPIKVRIEAKLLMSVVLRTRNEHPQALAQAEDALRVAHSTQEIALASKAQFHRGLCFYHTEQYAEASWCFSLAAATENHIEEIKPWKTMAEESRLRFPIDDPRRYLSRGLEEDSIRSNIWAGSICPDI